jgi:hypothetical protein
MFLNDASSFKIYRRVWSFTEQGLCFQRPNGYSTGSRNGPTSTESGRRRMRRRSPSNLFTLIIKPHRATHHLKPRNPLSETRLECAEDHNPSLCTMKPLPLVLQLRCAGSIIMELIFR